MHTADAAEVRIPEGDTTEWLVIILVLLLELAFVVARIREYRFRKADDYPYT